MITLTEQAASKVKEMMAEEGVESLYLRVGVQPGGCSGFSYGMGFTDEKEVDDTEFQQHGIKILVDETSQSLLKGTTIDYKESMMGGGFSIDNPNAVSSCGCGSSFHTKEEQGQPENC